MKKITLFGAISIGIGGMVGGGIFAVLGDAVSLAHGATPITFFLAGVIAFLTAYSYAKLSVAFQSRGGTVIFIDKAFGHNLLSGSVNLMLWLSYLVTISLYAVAFASYGATFFSHTSSLLHHLLISFAILLPAVINLLSASLVGKSETFIVTIKVAILILVIALGMSHVEYTNFSPSHYESSFSIVAAGMIIFVAYEGFELIANAAQSIEEPSKNLPRAFFLSVGIVILLYILIAVVTVGTVNVQKLIEAKEYALALAAEPSLGSFGFTLVAVAALLSTFSAINATIFGNARLGYVIAKDGELPTLFEYERAQVPIAGVLLTLFFSLILSNSINLEAIAIIASAGFLLIFFIVNLSALKLYKSINANRYIVSLASLLSFLALCILLLHTYKTNPKAVTIFLMFIVSSVVFELLYGKMVRGHIFQRKYS
ncbi:MAG: amino acid permease [Campylobacterales bacterium]|nr:amino acid permease [Campylobacterales bacterium]